MGSFNTALKIGEDKFEKNIFLEEIAPVLIFALP